MIDTHAHLDCENFDQDRELVVQRFFELGGKAIITIGIDQNRNKNSFELVNKFEKVFFTVGFHPEYAGTVFKKKVLADLGKYKNEKKLVAIGEIGLDYFYNRENRKEQKELFLAQLRFAKKIEKPVVLHCRDAYEDMFEIISDEEFANVKMVMHCYNGNLEQTRKFLTLENLIFSFTGNVTFADFDKFKNGKLSEKKSQLFEVLGEIPLEKMMIETDCPFLAPSPHRGKRNEPSFVRFVLEQIAKVKGISEKDFEKKTDTLANEFFCLGF